MLFGASSPWAIFERHFLAFINQLKFYKFVEKLFCTSKLVNMLVNIYLVLNL